MKLIIARDKNNGIGLEGKLPWHFPEDLEWFKENTSRKTVVMGRTTYEGIGKLPYRHNIVITTTPEKYTGDEELEFMTLNQFLNREPDHKPRGWLIGGGALYKTLLPYVDEAYVTNVEGEYECDAHCDINFEDEGFTEMHQFKLSDKCCVTCYWRN